MKKNFCSNESLSKRMNTFINVQLNPVKDSVFSGI